MNDNNCIFCKIAHGEIPVHKIYEDNDVIAFLELNPIREGHTLVIPKNHIEYVKDIQDIEYTKLMLVVKKIMNIVDKTFNPKRVGLMVLGWDVPHAHVHVVPMHDTQDITSKPWIEKTSPTFTEEEFSATAKKMRAGN